jgi:hypothetical protein
VAEVVDSVVVAVISTAVWAEAAVDLVEEEDCSHMMITVIMAVAVISNLSGHIRNRVAVTMDPTILLN